MLTQRRGELFDEWIGEVDTNGTAPLRSFAAGLRTDLDAVTAGLTLPYSSGPSKAPSRIKVIKRQMYGRAKFDLLRNRILHPA